MIRDDFLMVPQHQIGVLITLKFKLHLINNLDPISA